MKKLIKELKKGRLYDYISNEGHNYSKNELIQVIKELDYAKYTEGSKKYNDYCEVVSNELIELYED